MEDIFAYEQNNDIEATTIQKSEPNFVIAYNKFFYKKDPGLEYVYYIFWAFILFTIIYALVALAKELKTYDNNN